ncbi:ATP-binding protein [Kitasatospora sp. NPDC090091]|uniref:ATP-binding protein n=1 Tax=Kitasatospora sp. NPDC090091 TaxID=3364081 RepID=UPI0037F47BB0
MTGIDGPDALDGADVTDDGADVMIDGADGRLTTGGPGGTAAARWAGAPEDPAAFAAEWEQGNNAYLAASLHWLRLRLQALAAGELPVVEAAPGTSAVSGTPAAPDAPVSGSDGRGHGWPFRRRTRPEQPAAITPAPPPAATPDPAGPHPAEDAPAEPRPAGSDLAEAVARAAAAREAAAAAVHPAHVELADRLGLTAFERDVLLLAAAREFDPSLDALCVAAGALGREPGPTFGLALRLFEQPAWDALSPERPLRRLHLLEPEGAGGLTARVLRADERIVNYLKGLGHLDARLAETVVPLDDPDGLAELTASQLAAASRLRAGLRRAAADGRPPAVNLVGPDQVSKQLLAARVAAELGRLLVRVPVGALPVQPDAAALTARLWERETLLAPLALYLDAGEDGAEHGPERAAAVGRLFARVHGPVFLDSREVWPQLGPGALVVDVAGPTTGEQRAVWAEALGPGGEGLAGELAAQFDLDPVAVALAARAVAGGGPDEPPEELRARVWGACLAVTRPRLDRLAQRLEIRARREDLVLPAALAEQLDRIRDQVRHRAVVYEDWGVARRTSRGLGITALFAGESGTGKTTAAEVLARELHLDLYRIDLSAVMSKYIGETEKNLRRLFDAAERGGAILLFDEAEALYGRRSEVKDSHDRYANVQVGYLLQRMESYRGLAILATNMKGALDQAFTRRLRFVLDFPFPGPAEREEIWRRAFAPGVATDLDHARLAGFGLAGGSIHTVAMNATFAAAADGLVADMPTVLAALRMECRKLGLVVDEGEFARATGTAAGASTGADGSADGSAGVTAERDGSGPWR